jgi:hypothetical protein
MSWLHRDAARHHHRTAGHHARTGFDDERTAEVFRAFTAWLLGYVSVELRPMVDNPDESDPAFRLGLHRMPAQELIDSFTGSAGEGE